MKTQNLIGAVMMVSLSFTACQKSELISPANDSSLQSNKNSQATSAIPDQQSRKNNDLAQGVEYPAIVKDHLAETDKFFTYDVFHQLISIKEGSMKVVFKYDRSGRATQMITSTIQNSVPFEKVSTFEYEGNSLKPTKIIESINNPAPDQIILKTVLVKYDALGNKISETEIPGDRGAVLTRLFDYDARGNCSRIREMIGRRLILDKQFSEFDLRKSFDANLPALAFIPGEVIQKNNPAHITEISSTGVMKSHLLNFEYDKYGYVTKVYEMGVDKSILSKSIGYDTTEMHFAVTNVAGAVN